MVGDPDQDPNIQKDLRADHDPQKDLMKINRILLWKTFELDHRNRNKNA